MSAMVPREMLLYLKERKLQGPTDFFLSLIFIQRALRVKNRMQKKASHL